jgi:hypothetical protein
MFGKHKKRNQHNETLSSLIANKTHYAFALPPTSVTTYLILTLVPFYQGLEREALNQPEKLINQIIM